jgi:hypothetical protein
MNLLLRRVWIALFVSLCIGVQIVGAQGEAIPIALGENKLGQVEANSAAAFALTVTTPQTVTVQLLGVSEGFAAGFAVYDALDLLIADVPNDAGATVIESTVTLSTPGRYLIEVGGVGGLGGQFLLSVQAAGALAPAEAFPSDTPITDTLSQADARRAYQFSGAADALLLLTAQSDGATHPTFLLRDATTNALLGASSTRLAGAFFRIPPGASAYILEVLHSGASTIESYTVCVTRESAPRGCTGVPSGSGAANGSDGVIPTLGASVPTQVPPVQAPTQAPPAQATLTPVIVTNAPTVVILPTLPTTGGCVVAPSSTTTVNVRSGPATTFGVIAQLPFTQFASVTGRLSDNSWYQVSYNGLTGWISASVVRLGGNCGGVPIVGLTATPTLLTLASATPSSVFTLTPSITPPPTTPPPRLNFGLPPNFGSTTLTSGFVPDPFTRGMTSGGIVDVSYLGSGCRGFASSAPDFSVTYTSGAFPLLRFYFVGSGDTTLIINSPSGSYFCNDDSFGTLNPTIDFNSPSSGRYDIWIGSFTSGAFVSGTLNVTESSGNRP